MTPATRALDRAGITYELLPYEHDPRAQAYGLEAAEALAIDPRRIFKTLLVELDSGELATVILPVDRRLNLKAAAKALGAKRARMANPHDAERASGYVLGGISPFGQKRRQRTVLDASALGLEALHVSGGRRGLQVRLRVNDLIAQCAALSADITAAA